MYRFVSEIKTKQSYLTLYIMKIKAILFAAAIFGATFFVTSTTENTNNDTKIEKQAVDKRLIKVPAAG